MSSLFKSTTTYDPIFALLNGNTEDERDRLTEKWRDHKLEELNFVGIVVDMNCEDFGYKLLQLLRAHCLQVFSHLPVLGLLSYPMALYSHGLCELVGIVALFSL